MLLLVVRCGSLHGTPGMSASVRQRERCLVRGSSMTRMPGLSSGPHATPATPIRVPSGSVKWPTTRPFGDVAGPITRVPPRLSARCNAASTSRDAHVEDGVALVARSAADPASDACSVLRGDEVQEPVALRLGDLLRHRRGRVELPPEQVAVVVTEFLRIVADDLEVHHRLSHDQSSLGIAAATIRTGPIADLIAARCESGSALVDAPNRPTCTVRPGTAIFLFSVFAECSDVEAPPFFGRNEAAQRRCSLENLVGAPVDAIPVSIDGGPPTDIFSRRYLAVSPQMTATLPDENILACRRRQPPSWRPHGWR